MPNIRQRGVLTLFLLFRRKSPNTFLARWENIFAYRKEKTATFLSQLFLHIIL
jgi:hypothetical protein